MPFPFQVIWGMLSHSIPLHYTTGYFIAEMKWWNEMVLPWQVALKGVLVILALTPILWSRDHNPNQNSNLKS
jgi:hypothetical protein